MLVARSARHTRWCERSVHCCGPAPRDPTSGTGWTLWRRDCGSSTTTSRALPSSCGRCRTAPIATCCKLGCTWASGDEHLASRPRDPPGHTAAARGAEASCLPCAMCAPVVGEAENHLLAAAEAAFELGLHRALVGWPEELEVLAEDVARDQASEAVTRVLWVARPPHGQGPASSPPCHRGRACAADRARRRIGQHRDRHRAGISVKHGQDTPATAVHQARGSQQEGSRRQGPRTGPARAEPMTFHALVSGAPRGEVISAPREGRGQSSLVHVIDVGVAHGELSHAASKAVDDPGSPRSQAASPARACPRASTAPQMRPYTSSRSASRASTSNSPFWSRS